MTAAAKHTAGPWNAARDGFTNSSGAFVWNGRFRVTPAGSYCLVRELSEADANLIAAAPGLLAEGRALIERLSTMAIHPSHYAALQAVVIRAGGEL